MSVWFSGTHSSPGSQSRPRQGFTLVEVLVALLLATLLIASVPPLLTGSLSATHTHAAARQLAAGLRHTRSQAIALHREASLVLDVAQKRFRTSSGRYDVRLAQALELTLTTADSQLTGSHEGRILFFPDGSSSGGRIEIADRRQKYIVDVDWLTGRIDLHE